MMGVFEREGIGEKKMREREHVCEDGGCERERNGGECPLSVTSGEK
jgi:hypothetical protein